MERGQPPSRHTDTQTHRHTDTQTHTQTLTQTHRHTRALARAHHLPMRVHSEVQPAPLPPPRFRRAAPAAAAAAAAGRPAGEPLHSEGGQVPQERACHAAAAADNAAEARAPDKQAQGYGTLSPGGVGRGGGGSGGREWGRGVGAGSKGGGKAAG